MEKPDAPPSAAKKLTKRRIAFGILCFVLLAALWWAALWYALPVEWLQGPLASLVALHAAPPLLVAASWWAGKKAWAWRMAKREKRATDTQAAQKGNQLAASRATHQEMLEKRRAHVECRAVCAEFAPMPDWAKDGAEQCALLEQPSETLQGTGREAALVSSLERVLAATFKQCKAAVWLPVMVLADEPGRLRWVGQAWRQAVAGSGIERFPQTPECAALPGSGEIADRFIDLFVSNPTLPAAVVVGMDSPLADADAPQTGGYRGRMPGHAALALLLSRPGLTLPDEEQAGQENDGPYTPYWEKERRRKTGSPLWERIPAPLRMDFWNLAPFAALHRSAMADGLASKRERVRSREIRDAILAALINAGLRDLPFKEEKKDADSKKDAQPEAEDAVPPEIIGWLVHDAAPPRFVALLGALSDCGCEIDCIAEASNLKKEHGDVGAARGALMLAAALVQAAKLQKPVLAAGFDGNGHVGICAALPPAENVPAEEAPPEAGRV